MATDDEWFLVSIAQRPAEMPWGRKSADIIMSPAERDRLIGLAESGRGRKYKIALLVNRLVLMCIRYGEEQEADARDSRREDRSGRFTQAEIDALEAQIMELL